MKPFSCAFLVVGLLGLLAMTACNSATSGGGSSVRPVPLDPNDPIAPEPPSATPAPLPPNSGGTSGDAPAGCPDRRVDSQTATDLDDVAEVRARLAGIYRDCHGSYGTELRLDPNSDTRLLLWSLDERFVRQTTPATSGWIDIQSCNGSSCTVEWHIDDLGGDAYGPIREMTLWSDPIAVRIEVEVNGSLSYSEWVRVSK